MIVLQLIDLFSLITGEDTGGTWTRTGGTGGTFNAAAGTFTPAPGATTSTFQYTLTPAPPCTGDDSTATVNINPAVTAGTDGATTICDDSVAVIDLFSLITGEDTGGTWTRTGGTGGTFNAAAGTFTPAPGATTSTFDYTVTGVAPCADDTSTATVNINAAVTAGTDGATTICDDSVAVIDLFSLITGEDAGGTWVRTGGTGGTFNAAAGTFTPAAGATTSTFDYTVTGVAPCTDDTSTATININPAVTAGTDGATTICDDSVAVIDLFSLITGEDAGGTWVRTGGTGGTFNAAAGTFTPAAGATTSTFDYTVTGIAPCPDDTSTATVNINPAVTAGTDGATTICDDSVAVIDLFSLITGEDAGGTWVRTGGTGGTFNAAAGTFTPAAGATTSTFDYTVTGVAPCTDDTSTATININPAVTAGTDGATTICDDSVAVIDLFSLITGEDAGGTWVRTGGTGGTFNAAAGTFTPAAGATTSTFDYTVTGIAPCPDDTSTATVNINPAVTAGTDGGTTICSGSTAAIDLFTLITGETPGGTWVRTGGTGGTFNAAAGTFTPGAGTTTSTFDYTVTGVAPCPSDTSTATVTVSSGVTAGTDGATTICDDSVAVIDLYSLITGEDLGGVWTRTGGTGGTFNAAAGTFTPAPGATTSTFQYTLTPAPPCVGDDSMATININPAVTAGTDGATTICDDSVAVIDLFSLITGEDAGGTWVRTSGTGGTFNAAAGTFTPAAGATTSTFDYTLTAIAPCTDDTSTATVNINAAVTAGTDGATTICDDSVAVIDLFSLITGEDAGGTWVRTSGTAGTFNAAAGTFTPAAGATTSTFDYTLTAVAPCTDDTSTATVNINPAVTAGTDGGTTICDDSVAVIDLFSLITGEDAGGTWVRTSGTGGTFNAAAGTFTPAVGATTSTFDYTLTAIAPCADDTSTATITIDEAPVVTLVSATCAPTLLTYDVVFTVTPAGSTIVATAGTVVGNTVINIPTGTNITITATNPVNGTCVGTLDITAPNCACPQVDAPLTPNNPSICDGDPIPVLSVTLAGAPSMGDQVNWYDAPVGGTLLLANSLTYTPAGPLAPAVYTFYAEAEEAVSGCVSPTRTPVTLTVQAQVTAGTDGATTVCDDSTTAIDLFTLIAGEDTGGVWVRTGGTGGTFNAAAGTFTPAPGATTSTFDYTVSAIAPCPDDTSIATVNINPAPNAGADGATTVCDDSVAAIDLFSLITGEDAGGVWVQTSGTGGTFNAAAGTYTPAPGATTSTFEYTVTGIAPCGTDTSIATVNINPAPNAGTDGATTVCDDSVAAIDLFSLITGEDTGGVWVRTSGTGGTFNAAAGTFTPAPGATTSTFDYTATGIAPCGSDTSTATVNINPAPNAGTDGATTVCDDSIAAVDLFSLITGEDAGGVWVQTSGTGGTFNAAAGTYTPAPGATTSTFEYTVTGIAPCGTDTSIATVNINAAVTAGTDGATTVCDDSVAAIDLFSLITGEDAGGTWVRTSGTGGVFDAAAGTYTPALGATTSTFDYTVNGIAPCGSDTSTATVNINGVVNAGADGETEVCDNDTGIIDLFSLITGEDAGGTWVRTSGTGGTFNAAVGTFVPAVGATTSTFEYTVVGAAPCPNDTSIATVNINIAPTANAVPNMEVCDDDMDGVMIFDLTTQTPGIDLAQTGVTVTYYTSMADADAGTGAITNPDAYANISSPQTIWARITDDTTLCYNITSFDLIVNTVLAMEPDDMYQCDDDNDDQAEFDLATQIAAIQNGNPAINVTFHLTLDSAVNNGTPIDITSPYTNASDQNPQTIYIRVEEAGCSHALLSFDLHVVDGPELPTDLEPLVICDDNQDGFAVFDLTQAEANIFSDPALVGTPADYDVTYHLTEADADAGLNAIGTETAYTNATAYNQIIWVRVTSMLTMPDPCAAVRSLELIVNDAPFDTTTLLDPIIICDDLGEINDGITVFDLTQIEDDITLANPDLTVTYYNSYADAQTGTNPIDDPTMYTNLTPVQSIGFVVTDTTTGCTTAWFFTIEVKPRPTPYPGVIPTLEVCDGDTDGFASFDLTLNDALILSTDSSTPTVYGYYESYDDAFADNAPIGTPTAYTNISNPQTIWVRVQNGTTGCFEIVTFDIVNPVPTVNLTADSLTVCLDEAGDVIVDSAPTIYTGLDPVQYNFTWVLNGDTTNPLPESGPSITAIYGPGTYQVTVEDSMNGCFNTAEITIDASGPPTTYDAVVTTAAFSEDHVIEATASGNGTYEYSLDGGPFQSSGTFTGVEPGLHYVTIRDVNGCGEVVIEVCAMDYPKYFTPNADGFHDTWNITGGSCGTVTSLYIFDRYGKLLKQLDPNGNGWDGTYNGNAVPATDYWFKVTYLEDGVEKEFRSHFSIKR